MTDAFRAHLELDSSGSGCLVGCRHWLHRCAGFRVRLQAEAVEACTRDGGTYIYIYIYVYIYTYMYIHIYIYIYNFVSNAFSSTCSSARILRGTHCTMSLQTPCWVSSSFYSRLEPLEAARRTAFRAEPFLIQLRRNRPPTCGAKCSKQDRKMSPIYCRVMPPPLFAAFHDNTIPSGKTLHAARPPESSAAPATLLSVD